MTTIQSAAELHHQLVAAARRRNEREHDIPDPEEFERFVDVMEELGVVARNAEKKGYPPVLVGRSMQFYARGIAEVYGRKGMVPDAG